MTTIRDYVPKLTRELRAAGIGPIDLEYRGKHPSLVFEFRGERVRYFFPCSSGDHRGVHNCVSDLRRRIRANTFKRV